MKLLGVFTAPIAVAIALTMPAPHALAAWGPEGATIKSTTASIPMIVACTDGAGGTYVAWQEEPTSGSGTLFVQHVLENGDVDPAWPAAGMVACATTSARADLTVLPDGEGGILLCWRQGTTIRASRLDATGQPVAGWPACGVALGQASTSNPIPSAVGDGAHGLYVAWSNVGALGTSHPRPQVVHLAADGSVLASLDVALPSLVSRAWYPRVALAPDGGVYVAWGTSSTDTTLTPSDWRVRRLGVDGANADGWPEAGVVFGSFASCLVSSVLAIAPDGRGGAFLAFEDPYDAYVPLHLLRLDSAGHLAAGWPGEVPVSIWGGLACGDNAWASVRLMPDGQDGVFACYADMPYTDSPARCEFDRYLSDGTLDWVGSTSGDLTGAPEAFVKADGGIFLATFSPDGPYSQWDSWAFLSLQQSRAPSGWTGFAEYHSDPVVLWYGDIGLAPAPDGGCVFFWSQVHERFGLFARRFGLGGEVTATAPRPPAGLRIRALRFVSGDGIRAALTLPGDHPARLGLYDVAGRQVARLDLGGTGGARETTIPGTVSLPAGIYFARLSDGAAVVRGRVAVLR